MTDQQKNALLALSYIPGPVGNKFAIALAVQGFAGDQATANTFINHNTNSEWIAVARVAVAGGNTDKWLAKAKKTTAADAQSSLPTASDVAVMLAYLRT